MSATSLLALPNDLLEPIVDATGASTVLRHVCTALRAEPKPIPRSEAVASVAVFRWALRTLHLPLDVATCDAAARAGRLDVLQEARRRAPRELMGTWTFIAAAQCADVAAAKRVIAWLRATCEREWNWKVCTSAASMGHLELLEWLRAEGAECRHEACEAAAEQGHTPTVAYLLGRGCGSTPTTCARAAAHGHMDTLQCALAHGCQMTYLTTFWSAQSGQLGCLKYAIERGCEHDAATCTGAVLGNQLAVLQWLRSSECGCTWDSGVVFYAQQNKHTELLAWARDNGAPDPPEWM